MSPMGEAFTRVVKKVIRNHGRGSCRMVVQYYIAMDSGEILVFNGADPELLASLTNKGYLRTFVGEERVIDKRGFSESVVPAFFGLTNKGWSIADKYLKAESHGKP